MTILDLKAYVHKEALRKKVGVEVKATKEPKPTQMLEEEEVTSSVKYADKGCGWYDDPNTVRWMYMGEVVKQGTFYSFNKTTTKDKVENTVLVKTLLNGFLLKDK